MAKAKTTTKKVEEDNAPTITIDGKEYKIEELSDEAKTQIVNIRTADAEIQKIKNQLAMMNAARSYYANKLTELLPAGK